MPIMKGTLPSYFPNRADNEAMDLLSELHVWLTVTVESQIVIGVDIEGV